MYSVVLLVAATSGGDVSGFGGMKGGAGCHGATMSAGCQGSSCHCGGFLGGLRKGGHKSGCHGTVAAGCSGSHEMAAPAGCTGSHAAPAGCTGHAGPSMGCHGSSCHGGGVLGLRNGGGLFGKHKNGCSGGGAGCTGH